MGVQEEDATLNNGEEPPEAGEHPAAAGEDLHEPVTAGKGPDQALLTLDQFGAIASASAAIEGITGYRPSELIGKHLSRLYPEDAARQGVPSDELRAAEDEGLLECEGWRVRKDTSRYWASSTMAELRDFDGTLVGFAASIKYLGDVEPDPLQADAVTVKLEPFLEKNPLIAIQGFDKDGVVQHWNSACEGLYGYSEGEAIGRKLQRLILPDSAHEEFEKGLLEVLGSGVASEPAEWLVLNRKREERWVYSTMFPFSHNGSTSVIFCMDVDITDRKRAEEKLARLNSLYAVLSKVSEAAVRIREPVELYEQVCRIAVDDGRFLMAWVGLVDSDTQRVNPVARAGRDDGYLDTAHFTTIDIPTGRGTVGTAIREDRCDVCVDFESETRVASWRDEALERGFRSSASFPLKAGVHIVGALTLYAGEPHFFDEEQVRLLESLAENVSFAIESIDKEERRRKAERAQASSEKYFRSLLENLLDVIAVINQDRTIRYTSPSVERVLGYKRSELRDTDIFDFIHADDAPGLLEAFAEVIAEPGIMRDVEGRFRHRDGSYRMLEIVGRAYADETGATSLVINARDITGRKLVEEELRKSEETARALLNAPEDISLLIDAEGVVLAINETAARRYGRKPEELVGTRAIELFSPAVGDVRREKVVEVIRTRRPLRYEDSEYETVFDNFIYPVFDGSGKVTRLAIIARDITERRKAEEAQRKDRDLVSAVIDTTGALVVVLDHVGRIMMFNRSCERTTGFTFEEVRGRYVWDVLLLPEESEEVKRFFEKLDVAVLPPNYENHWLTKRGGRRRIEWSSTLLYGNSGTGEYVINTGIDVTERRKAEQALKESEEQYRTVFESTGTAMCIVSGLMTVSFLNKEFERMTGYGADEISGKMRFTEFLVEEDTEVFMGYYLEARRGQRGLPSHFECRIRDRGGDVLNVLVNMGLVPGRNSIVISLIDMTREKSYEQDLKETAERLRHFLTVASHELRHPVTIVKGYVNTLAEFMETMPPELVKEILEDIDSSTDRLTRYVEELLDVSRVEEGRFPVEKRLVECERLVSAAVQDMEVMGTEKLFDVTVVPGAYLVEVDPEKFVQLLITMLENAVQFSPPSSRIDVDVSERGDEVVVSVRDRGIGITEEHREKVFDRFYQVEDVQHHSTPGIGLGLYIAREIAGAHGGRIWCEPREGGGTVFSFAFPKHTV